MHRPPSPQSLRSGTLIPRIHLPGEATPLSLIPRARLSPENLHWPAVPPQPPLRDLFIPREDVIDRRDHSRSPSPASYPGYVAYSAPRVRTEHSPSGGYLHDIGRGEGYDGGRRDFLVDGRRDFLVPDALDAELVNEEEQIQTPVQTEKVDQRALFANGSLAYQRCLFLLLKFPALICILLGCCTIWGRLIGKPVGAERAAGFSAAFGGVVVFAFTIVLQTHHYNLYWKARWMAILRHGAVLVSVCVAIAIVVLSALTLHALYDLSDTQPCVGDCFSVAERVRNSAMMVGASSLLVIFAIPSLFLGCLGVYQMKLFMKKEEERVAAIDQAIYNNLATSVSEL